MAAARRFTNRREVSRIIRNGQRLRFPLGRIVILPAPGPIGRILFVVPKVVSKKSTVRNRIKRILAAWARERNVGAFLGRDLIVFVDPALAGMSPRAIRSEAEAMRERLAAMPRTHSARWRPRR